MGFFQWVIAFAVLASVILGGTRFYQVAHQQITLQQERQAYAQLLVERYRLQLQLQQHRQFLMHY